MGERWVLPGILTISSSLASPTRPQPLGPDKFCPSRGPGHMGTQRWLNL